MKYLPAPEYIDDPGSYLGNCRLSTTPYNNISWQETALKYGIKIPEIVDMTQGFSICNQCKAKYVGHQPKCSRIIIWHKTNEYWHTQPGYNPNCNNNFESVCNGSLTWDLSKEFSIQKEFFSLIDQIGSLPDITYDPLAKFEQHFPRGVTDDLRVRLLAYDIDRKLYNITGAIQQIANKMNNAGACLSFSF